jgi:putative transposase
MKAFKYRLYPTKDQVRKLEWTLSRCCELYNAALQERKEAWNAWKRHANFYDPEWRQEHARDYRVNYYDQANALPELKRERTEYARIGSHVLQETVKRVEKAFQGFFRRVQCGQTPGYPRYKSYKRYESFCFPDHAGWKLTGNRLSISNLGTIKVKLHREVQGTIKTCTVKREGENWYVVLTCVVEACLRTPYTDLAIGIDLGLLHFATLSNGETIENPRFFRRAEKKLVKLQ